MSNLQGFVPFDFDEGLPYVSVTQNGITFNKGAVLKLGKPSRVELLINPDTKQIAIRGCGKKTPRSNAFYKENSRGVISVRWNMKDLLYTIQDMMSWNLELEGYRVEGQLLKEEGAMLFDLNEAKKLE